MHNHHVIALTNHVVVTPHESSAEIKTRGGLYVPDTTSNRPVTGTVVSVGEKLADSALAVGDHLLYIKGRGQEVVINDKAFLILEDKDILAKIS